MSSLHDQIMNLRGNVGMDATVYKIGHRDARHAAAELAIPVEKQRDELLAFIKRLQRVEAASSVLFSMRAEIASLIANAEAKP